MGHFTDCDTHLKMKIYKNVSTTESVHREKAFVKKYHLIHPFFNLMCFHDVVYHVNLKIDERK